MPEQAPGSLPAASGEATNVLLLAPSFEQGERGTCMELLAGEAPEEAVVVAVAYTRAPREWLSDWLDHTGVTPAGGVLVSVGSDRSGPDSVGGLDVVHLPNAANLTDLGVTLTDALEEEEALTGQVRVCFDSLTVLLQYVDASGAFRFLHALTSQVQTVEGVGHYHLDPTAHDEQTLATVRSVFDAVVTSENGEWTVQTR